MFILFSLLIGGRDQLFVLSYVGVNLFYSVRGFLGVVVVRDTITLLL